MEHSINSQQTITGTARRRMLNGIAVTTAFLSLTSPFTLASDEELFEPGLHGSVALIVGAQSSTPANGEVTDDNERINSLSESADSESGPVLGFGGGLSYTFENQRTQIYVASPELPAVFGESALEIGMNQLLVDGMVLTAAYIPKISGAGDDVWEDPYLTGTKRKETDAETDAFKIGVENIFGLPLSAQYAFGKREIDNERAGTSLLNQPGGITEEEMKQLRRSADYQQIQISSTIPLSEALYFTPSIHYTKGDADGNANSFKGVGGGLELSYLFSEDYILTTGVSYEPYDYDASHPVFDKTRDDKVYSAEVILTVGEPFDWDNTSLSWFASYSQRDSNIKFYEFEEAIIGASLSYEF